MASLGAHIRRTDGHGDLGFHPACPICRDERLAGSFPPTSLSVRRVQAGLAAGAIVMTSIVPTGAFASMGSPEFEGTAPPEAVGDLDKELGAGEDSGVAWQETEEAEEPAADDPATAGTDGAAPEAAEAPGAQASPEAAPEPEVVDSTEAEAPESEEPAAEETASEAAASPADPVPEAAAPTPAPEAPAAATLTSRDASRAHAKAKRAVRREVRRARQEARAASERARQAPTTSAQAAPAPAAPAVAVASAPAPKSPPAAPTATTVKRDTVKPGDRTHVVQRGESLWSIAADLLGDDASPARVAREVNRLWELNKSRIGTGDRDLVHAGTKLRLA